VIVPRWRGGKKRKREGKKFHIVDRTPHDTEYRKEKEKEKKKERANLKFPARRLNAGLHPGNILSHKEKKGGGGRKKGEKGGRGSPCPFHSAER